MNHPDVEFFQEWKNSLIEFSRKLNIPLVATQDSHYLHPDDALAHKTLVAISTNTDIGDTAIFSGKDNIILFLPKRHWSGSRIYPKPLRTPKKLLKGVMWI